MKGIATTVCFILFGTLSFTQTVILERSVEESDTSEFMTTTSSRWTIYSDFEFGVPYAIGDEGAATQFWGTTHFEFGSNYNFRIADFFSVGAILNFMSTSYRIAQKEEKLVMDTILHDKEKINLLGIAGGGYLRFSYSKGIPGKYVDVGIKEFYALGRKYKVWDDLNDVAVETIIHKPDYLVPLQTYAFVNFGFNGVGIFANYRVTDIFDADYQLPEFSRFTAGVQFNFSN